MNPCIFNGEFTHYIIDQVVDEFGLTHCSENVKATDERGGSSLTREIVVAHAIEPNKNAREVWDTGKARVPGNLLGVGNATSPQSGGTNATGFLRKRGYFEKCAIVVRWDLVSNDAYGRSPGMDALSDIKQLQQETKRKAQAIDKQVNPPMVADIQLKNQPAEPIWVESRM